MKTTTAATAASAAKRRAQTHCKRGHPLSGKNLFVTKGGHRQCRACRVDSVARCRALLAAAMIAQPEHPLHGTANGYINGLCRCYRCCYARSEAGRRWRQQRRARAAA